VNHFVLVLLYFGFVILQLVLEFGDLLALFVKLLGQFRIPQHCFFIPSLELLQLALVAQNFAGFVFGFDSFMKGML
jgi:hypothetical protein